MITIELTEEETLVMLNALEYYGDMAEKYDRNNDVAIVSSVKHKILCKADAFGYIGCKTFKR